MASAMGVSWDVVFGKPAVECLNVMAYLQDKAEWEKEELERWKRTH